MSRSSRLSSAVNLVSKIPDMQAITVTKQAIKQLIAIRPYLISFFVYLTTASPATGRRIKAIDY